MTARAAPVLLAILTGVTGIVDAVSFLSLGHVFVANMTGNVAFIAFAAAGAPGLSIGGSLIALAAFMLGAFAGGRLDAATNDVHRLLRTGVALKVALTAAAFGVSLAYGQEGTARIALLVLLALAMGLQSAIVRRAAGGEPSTNVLTTTLTALAVDAPIGGGNGPLAHRVLATVTMFAGAAAGAALVLHAGPPAAIALAVVLLAASALAVHAMRC